MEVIEARAKGSGWEITSTLTARENEKKKKKKKCDDTKNFKHNFKNAVQSFITFNAFCPPTNGDGVHQLTDKSAQGAPHPSKKMKRIGNEENELDRAALAEIRSMNASRDTKVMNTKKRKLGSEGEQEEQELEEQKEEEEEERQQRQNDSKPPAANERRFFALYGGGEDEANAGLNQAGIENKEEEEKKVEIAVAVVKEKEECGRKTSPPATKMSYANMRKEAVPGTVQIISASGKKHIVSATKGWNEVRSDNTSNAVERIEKGPTEQIPTSTRAPDEAVSCGIFSTGSGRAIKFKNIEKSLARGRALLTGTPDISGVAPSSPHDVNRSEYLNARNSMLIESGQLDYQTPMNSSRHREIGGGRGGFGSSIFSTGNGKTMRVSEASLERGRMLLDASDAANKTPVSTTHIGTSALTMSEKRPPGFPLVENKTHAPNSAPSAARFRAAHNHQRQYQNMSRMNPEQHRTSGENAFTPPVGSTRTTLQRQKDSTLNHLPTHDLFKSRIGRQKLSDFFDGALPFSGMGDAPMTDILAANITFDSAQEYRIADIVVNSNLDAQSLTLGWRDIRDLMFTRGAKEKNLSEEWCANAYRHVVWTAASLKRAFGRKASQALSAKHVLERMMYRYEREINQMRRPVLRRVLERDSPSTIPMVLLVSAIRSFGMCFEEENEENEEEKCKRLLYPAEIEVSDGWYSVRAVLDDVLSSHLRANRIRVGSKMFVQNCQLNGTPEGEGVQPLKSEAYKARLLLHSNSCRPCKWDAKLGLQKVNLTVPLCSVRIDGGDVPRVLLRIDRHFPPVYRERTFASRDDDSNVDSAVPAFVTRREETEISERDKFETLQRKVIERALNKDNAENESQDMSNYEKAVSENRTAHFEKQLHLRQEEVKLRALEEAGIPERRNVSRVCRILAHGLIKRGHRIDTFDSMCPKKGFSQAVVMVWDADEAFTSALEEGCVYAATHLKATEGKDEIQLTGTKHTRWTKISSDTVLHAGLHIIEKTSREKSYVDCLAIHLLTGPQFLENGGRRFAIWMFFIEIKNDDGSIIVHPNARAELFAVKISGWDEIELEKNCTRWTNLCEKCDNKCVLLRNITPDDVFDEKHLVRKSSASVETFEVLASATKAKHLASRLDRFQSHFSHETRDFVRFMRDRAMSLVSNSNNNAKEPTLSQFTPPRIQFEDEDNTRRRSSIRLSDSEGWGGSQWPRTCFEE
jgi:hypothetical protein